MRTEVYRVSSRSWLSSIRGVPSPPGGSPEWYADPVSVRTVATASTAATLSNSAAETVVAQLALPSLSLDNQGSARLSVGGTILNSAVAAGTVTFRLKWTVGASTQTIAATSAISCSTSNNRRAWAMEVVSHGNQPTINTHWGVLGVTAPSTRSAKPTAYTGVVNSTTTFSEADAITVKLTAQLSSANANFSLVRNSAVLEVLN